MRKGILKAFPNFLDQRHRVHLEDSIKHSDQENVKIQFEEVTKSVWSSDKVILKQWQSQSEAVKKSFWSSEKFILKQWQSHFEAVTKSFWSSGRVILKQWQSQPEAATKSFWSGDKVILKQWQSQFEAVTKSVWSSDKVALVSASTSGVGRTRNRSGSSGRVLPSSYYTSLRKTVLVHRAGGSFRKGNSNASYKYNNGSNLGRAHVIQPDIVTYCTISF